LPRHYNPLRPVRAPIQQKAGSHRAVAPGSVDAIYRRGQSREKMLRTYQNISATEANSASEAAT
jgi:hypothetical protein